MNPRLSIPVFGLLTWLTLNTQAVEDSKWQGLRVPGFWEKSSGGVVAEHDGFAWYRCFLRVPADWQGETLTLDLGRIDDCDETFFNGAKIGARGTIQPYHSASGEARQYAIAPDRIRTGDWNLLTVRVWDGGGAGGIAAGPLRLSCGKGGDKPWRPLGVSYRR